MNHVPAIKSRTPFKMRFAARIAPHVAVGVFVLILSVLAVLWFRGIFRPAPYRRTIVIAGNPTHVVSLNATKTGVTLIDVPEDTVISAVKGYGNYSVRSLITLDGIDKHHGTLVATSLSDALGVPISGYVGPSNASEGEGSVEMVRRVFSFGSIGRVLSRTVETSIPLPTWINLVFVLRFIPADAVEILSIDPAIISTESPDGNFVPTLDESKLDFVLQNSLFDTGLRAENLTVALYNTTQIPTVGQRASRQLSRMGIQLVFVGNADTSQAECIITGSDTAIRSKTAQFIASFFSCNTMAEQSNIGRETGADLIVALGTDYASQYK